MKQYGYFALAVIVAICTPAAIIKWSVIFFSIIGYLIYRQTQE